MYIARHYVNVNGKMFTPGEVITEKITEEQERFLMGHDAISKMETAPIQHERGPVHDGKKESAKQEDDKQDYAAPVASALPEPEEADDTDDTEDEEDAEAPEIDVTDGIVTEPEPEEAHAASTSKRGGKKK